MRAPKTKKVAKIEAKPTWHHFHGKSNQFVHTQGKKKKKTGAQRRAHDLENKDVKLSSKTWFNSRIQICFK
jgi:hypothetical protein